MKAKFLLLGMIFLLILPNFVAAQTTLFDTKWYEYLNIPEEYTRPPNLLYFVILPFLGTFAIIFGILTGTRAAIFQQKRVNVILSLIFSLAIFYAFSLPVLVATLFQIGAGFAVVVFFILFMGLTGLWAYRRTYGAYKATEEIKKKYKSARKARISMTKDMKKIDERVKKIDKEIKELRDQIDAFSAALMSASPNRRKQLNNLINTRHKRIQDLQIERTKLLERKDKLLDEYTKVRA